MTKSSIPTIRAQITKKQAEIALAACAGRPIAETLPGVAEQLAHLAEPYLRAIGSAAREVIAARGAEVPLHSAFNLGFAPTSFAIGAIVALLRDRILADLDAEIERQADAMPPALADDAQRLELFRLRSELRTLERDEEALIVAEAERGSATWRRGDADPVAVLEIPDGIAEEFGL